MADFVTFQGIDHSLQIEVGDGEQSGSANIQEIIQIIRTIAEASADELARIPKESKPSEINMHFGIRALKGGAVTISLGDVATNFKVEFRWNGGGGADNEEYF